MNRDGYWILVAAVRIKISGPLVCFRARQPRLWSKCDTHAHLHYKKVLENERMKFSSSTPVAQILQNYFVRLLLWNLLSEALITCVSSHTYQYNRPCLLSSLPIALRPFQFGLGFPFNWCPFLSIQCFRSPSFHTELPYIVFHIIYPPESGSPSTSSSF